MFRTHLARRAQASLALAAGAALLGLTACGADATPGAGDTDAPAAASDGGGQQADDAADDTDEGTDDGASDDGGSDDDTDAGGTTGERTSILLITEFEHDDGHGEGDPILSAEYLASLLTDTLGGEARCEDELTLTTYEPSSVQCEGPAAIEGEATSEWVASPIMLPNQEDGLVGARVSVLFTTGTEFPAGAADLQSENVMVTGVGMGSMFGAEPLSAQELAEATEQTLTSENAYVPVAGMADWEDIACEDGMDFTDFRTVDCEATTAAGDTYPLHVAPGTFVENDHGLLVGIVTR